ncbi:tRNA (N6-isopentenyl adenosine(37)-C2)-methylthiotransferase MiaB [Desulfogranum marinum]|uniref:tRNA (N6-isopentenyl adenosine(37)-C2)-methylthiotransferase MiaB n=1 Tax=Desulfogranum marinum TaxID=453220 RepID=UPI001963EA29|nr:tRNA (N6-isopentenyl adenosine(37)-C2)-methylthiotransferase MiaB [Desulfogranum marinum]MBM9511542.1 tRNA (N6-isopentenyl adenosine(37)-C2)-methylthiotransferase MiaB [Desulfogranum marinum]
MEKRLYIKTFGCQMNIRDSEIIEQLLAQDGYLAVDAPDHADVIILNTCSIRAKAEQKVFSLLGQLRDTKKQHPTLRIGVAGCVAQQEGDQIFKRMPHVDFIVGTQQIYQLPEILYRLNEGQTVHEKATDLDNTFSIPPFQQLLTNKTTPKASAESGLKRFVTIMQGCNNYCSYCVVPYTRGREISRPVTDIVEEVEILVDQGVKEITLLGQNVNSYGMTNAVADTPVSFAQLLRQVAAVKGLGRLRFTTSNPKDLSEDLMRCFAELENLCPHFHLPVQSGSNRILALMNRKYTIEEYLQKVETLRSYRPEIALATDMIIGFPGETDADFEQTVDLLKTVQYHGSFSFKYSDRPFTRSADFPDKVPEEVKSERLRIFQNLQDEISLARNNDYLGHKVEVMVETVTAKECKGRTSTNHIVHFVQPRDTLAPGDIAHVTINHAGKHSLKGLIT